METTGVTPPFMPEEAGTDQSAVGFIKVIMKESGLEDEKALNGFLQLQENLTGIVSAQAQLLSKLKQVRTAGLGLINSINGATPVTPRSDLIKNVGDSGMPIEQKASAQEGLARSIAEMAAEMKSDPQKRLFAISNPEVKLSNRLQRTDKRSGAGSATKKKSPDTTEPSVMYVSRNGALLRAEKTRTSVLIDTLSEGAELQVISIERGWALVQTKTGVRGWITLSVLNSVKPLISGVESVDIKLNDSSPKEPSNPTPIRG